jgi:hypothetical protein
MTKLEAVNRMLRAIGESSVSSLTDPGSGDVALAIETIDRTRLEILARGWYANTLEELVLEKDAVTNKIPLPTYVLSIRRRDDQVIIIERNGFLYDLKNNTDIFDDDVTVDAYADLQIENLPYSLANYIAVRSGRLFAQAATGSQTNEFFSVDDESRAYAEAQREDLEHGSVNFLNDWQEGRQFLARTFASGTVASPGDQLRNSL